VAAVLVPLIESGVVATCGVIEFELGWATRSSAEFDQVRADRDAGYEWLATHDEDWRRALDVQAALWPGGRMRAVGLPDLLIAAVAERERVTVLHYCSDYELIAQVTGQPVHWIVLAERFLDLPRARPDFSSPGGIFAAACNGE
jgi:predicted nucleic acid-binding protein